MFLEIDVKLKNMLSLSELYRIWYRSNKGCFVWVSSYTRLHYSCCTLCSTSCVGTPSPCRGEGKG